MISTRAGTGNRTRIYGSTDRRLDHWAILAVRMMGLEPTWTSHQILSLARIPNSATSA